MNLLKNRFHLTKLFSMLKIFSFTVTFPARSGLYNISCKKFGSAFTNSIKKIYYFNHESRENPLGLTKHMWTEIINKRNHPDNINNQIGTIPKVKQLFFVFVAFKMLKIGRAHV